jgi:hypothetical protein
LIKIGQKYYTSHMKTAVCAWVLWNFVSRTKIRQNIPILIKTGQKYHTSHMKTAVCAWFLSVTIF